LTGLLLYIQSISDETCCVTLGMHINVVRILTRSSGKAVSAHAQ